ncbi:MAG: putative bifunctional diguanylate cyclase/phosphodiesterase [Solirubrobacteraceae bacterium]
MKDGPSRPARVLLVQDDPGAALALGEMLRAVWPHGLVLSQTPSVTDAVQELGDHGSTCVLVDVPGGGAIDAVEAVGLLNAASPETPIIVLAPNGDEQAGVLAVRAGAQDHLLRSGLSPATLSRAVGFAIERKRAEAALAQQALEDPLTALPNRTLFLDRLRGALDRSRRTGGVVTVLFLDVDGFKEINDSLGHHAGDRVLTVLAERFRGLLRPMDTVARFGGDEFTFLFEGLQGERDAAIVARRVSRSAGVALALADQTRSVSVSIGVAIVTDPDAAIEDVIRRADAAMYRAKELGGDRVEVFDGRMDGLPGARAELEQELRHAVTRAELRLHYQPRVSLNGDTGLVGFEALVRWQHPERGLLEPGQFIPIAEESGMIVPIGEWVIEQALAQVARWRESRPDLTVSVNLSAGQLRDPGLIRRLAAAISDAGHEPGILCLEVAEGAVAADPELARRQLAALNELGVQLAIDDFGTGDASSTTLAELPVHILKLDQRLISLIGDGPASGVSAAVQLGHALGLSVVAEGVETDAQLAQLRELHCDGAQGFLFSRPLPEESIHGLLGVS